MRLIDKIAEMRGTPRLAQSLEEFIAKAKAAGCENVTIELGMQAEGSSSKSVGVIGKLTYGFRYTAPSKRPVVFKQPLAEHVGTEKGSGDREDRRHAAMRAYLLGEDFARKLKEDGFTVSVVGPRGVMNEDDWTQLHHDAKLAGVCA